MKKPFNTEEIDRNPPFLTPQQIHDGLAQQSDRAIFDALDPKDVAQVAEDTYRPH